MQKRRIKKRTAAEIPPCPGPQQDPADTELERNCWQGLVDFWAKWCPRIDRGKVVGRDAEELYPSMKAADLLRMIHFWRCLHLHIQSCFRKQFSNVDGRTEDVQRQYFAGTMIGCANRAVDFLALAAEERGLNSESIRQAHSTYKDRLAGQEGLEWLRDPDPAGNHPTLTPENVLEVVPSRQRLSDADRAGYKAGLKEIGRLAMRLKAEVGQRAKAHNTTTPKKTRRRKHRRPSLDIPPTARQTEVMTVVSECEGNLAAAGRRLGLHRKTIEQHYNVGMKKLGIRALPRAKTLQIPQDRRGQETVADQDDGPAAIESRKPAVPRNHLR